MERSRKERIESALRRGLEPLALEVQDESGRHSVPAGAETHFNVMLVSRAFQGLGRIDRHRRVHELLRDELAGGLHALTLTLLTPDESAGREALASPACMGGSKAS